MSSEVQDDIIVSDGKHEIDVAEQEVSLIRHMIRYDPDVGWNGYRVVLGKSVDNDRNVLDGNESGLAGECRPQGCRSGRCLSGASSEGESW